MIIKLDYDRVKIKGEYLYTLINYVSNRYKKVLVETNPEASITVKGILHDVENHRFVLELDSFIVNKKDYQIKMEYSKIDLAHLLSKAGYLNHKIDLEINKLETLINILNEEAL